MLEIHDLTVNYNPRSEGPVLKGLSMTLSKEKAAIVGPNGSGKSTIFRAVLGLVQIQSGSVKAFGTDVRMERGDVRVSRNLAEVYRLAYVPAHDIVSIFAELKGSNPETAFKLFHDFQLDGILRKRIHEMSTGQQKMFGNIMAISFSPKLVLLDEPFDNVDENRRRKKEAEARILPRRVGQSAAVWHRDVGPLRQSDNVGSGGGEEGADRQSWTSIRAYA